MRAAAALALALLLAACGSSEREDAAPRATPSPTVAPTPSPTPEPPREFTTPSGAQVRVLEWGAGAKPAEGATVTLHYTLWLGEDEAPLAGTRADGAPLRVGLADAGTLLALREAAPSLPAGTRATIVAPPAAAHGDEGLVDPLSGDVVVPPGATLRLEVEILEVESP